LSSKPILSVVRALFVVPTEEDFQTSAYNATAWHRERCSEDERRENFRRFIENHNNTAGCFVKSGGGKLTPNMQEAQVFGWSRNAKENLQRYKAPYYEIIPVTIEMAK